MRRGKRVVDIDIAERGERLREIRIVRLLAGVEAQVFEERDLARARAPRRRARASGPMQSSAKVTGRPPSARLSGGTSGRSEHAGSPPSGRPKCDITTNSRALGDQLLDGRRQPLDPGRVGDLAVLDRHVEIGAQQHPLAGDVEIVEDSEIRH